MDRLVIIGASGHGKVVADIAKLNGYTDIVFLDDNEDVKECDGYSVIGKSDNAPAGLVFVAIGNARVRRKLIEKYSDRIQPVLIHPNAVVARSAKIGYGTVIMAGAVVNSDAIIGKGVIVNTSSSIDHDCIVRDYCHVAVGAHLCGTVDIGESTWIGAGAIVSNNITICADCKIGAGAVVVKDIDKSGTYVGVPARYIK